MTIEEIRNYLRERGMEAVPVATSSTLADFISWSPENTAPIIFAGGNFPDGITTINANGCTASTVLFSDAFSNCHTVDLSGSNVVDLTLPASTRILILVETSQPVALTGSFPAGLRELNVANSLYTSLPTLPDGLIQLDVSSCNTLAAPALPASLTHLICDNVGLAHLPALAGTQLDTLQAANSALIDLPALPATLIHLYINGTPLTVVPTLPAATVQIGATDCGWDSGQVDNLLAQLVNNGAHNGAVLCDGNNDAPSAAGVASANTLTSRGWVVTTN